MNAQIQEQYFTLRKAEACTGIPYITLWLHMRNGTLRVTPPTSKGLIAESDLNAYYSAQGRGERQSEEWITVRDAAVMLKKTRQYVHKLFLAHRIQGKYFGAHILLVRSSVQEFKRIKYGTTAS